jgi:rhamnose utilization protein RhaD (predicted bifunctional aldolase and dehydrogenase)
MGESTGTKLREAKNKNIFIKLDLEKAKIHSLFDDPKIMHSTVVNSGNPNLMPSIKTAMHSMINAPVVTHVHALGAIGVSLLKDPKPAIKAVSSVSKMAWIPYVRPGADLAHAIAEVLTPYGDGGAAFQLLKNKN